MTNDLHSNVELPEHVVGGVRLRTTGLLERMEEQDTSLHQAVALMFDLGRCWAPPKRNRSSWENHLYMAAFPAMFDYQKVTPQLNTAELTLLDTLKLTNLVGWQSLICWTSLSRCGSCGIFGMSRWGSDSIQYDHGNISHTTMV